MQRDEVIKIIASILGKYLPPCGAPTDTPMVAAAEIVDELGVTLKLEPQIAYMEATLHAVGGLRG